MKRFYTMLGTYQKINVEENGISFTKEGFDQLYEEGIKGLGQAIVGGVVIGGLSVGAVTLGINKFNKHKQQNKKDEIFKEMVSEFDDYVENKMGQQDLRIRKNYSEKD